MTDYSYLLLSCGIMSLVVGQSIDGKPGARLDGCVGQDIEISWNFIDEANLNIATWSVISSSFTGNILRKFGSASASVLNSYNVVHNGNGKITLTSVTSDNSGNFTLSVTYSTGPGPGEDTVEVIANEAPTATLRWEDGSCQFDGGTTLDLVLSEEVNGTGKYCCVTGGAAACINGSTEPTYCIEGQSTTTTTTPSTATTTTSTTTTPSTTKSSTTTTSPSTTTTLPSTTLIAETTESDTDTAAVSNERTVIIVVASTVGGVVLVGLVVFLVGLFLYRARRPGHGKHNHSHKRNTRRQQSGSAYFYSGQNKGQDMAVHHSTASYMDTRHGNPHSIKDDPDKRLGVTNKKQANGRHEGSHMKNTTLVKSKYSVYPGNIVPSQNTQIFSLHHYPRHEEWQRPATTGNLHPGHVNHALQSGYNYYQPRDYSDNWNMY